MGSFPTRATRREKTRTAQYGCRKHTPHKYSSPGIICQKSASSSRSHGKSYISLDLSRKLRYNNNDICSARGGVCPFAHRKLLGKHREAIRFAAFEAKLSRFFQGPTSHARYISLQQLSRALSESGSGPPSAAFRHALLGTPCVAELYLYAVMRL